MKNLSRVPTPGKKFFLSLMKNIFPWVWWEIFHHCIFGSESEAFLPFPQDFHFEKSIFCEIWNFCRAISNFCLRQTGFSVTIFIASVSPKRKLVKNSISCDPKKLLFWKRRKKLDFNSAKKVIFYTAQKNWKIGDFDILKKAANFGSIQVVFYFFELKTSKNT